MDRLGLLDSFRRRRANTRPLLTREQTLQAMPVRNPSLTWRDAEDGEIAVALPRRNDTIGRLLALAFGVPESREVRLDEVGSFVWRRCDGEHNLSELIDEMARTYRLNRREVEVSLYEYIKTLSRRGMVAVAVPNSVLEGMDERTRKALGVKELGSGKTTDVPVSSGGETGAKDRGAAESQDDA